MARLNINTSKIKYNARVLKAIFDNKNMQFTPVIKCIAGDKYIINELKSLGITHFAESRINNIVNIGDTDLSFTLLRAPSQQQIETMVNYVDSSIQTEMSTIKSINDVAGELGKKHKVMLMVDWKDHREGVLTYDVIQFITEIIQLPHIHFIGLAFNFMCFKSAAPTEDDIFLMNKYVTSIERQLGFRLKVISGGNSSMLPQLLYNDLGKINDLRIGETLFRGVDTTSNKAIAMLYQDAITLEAEILEIKPRINSNNNEAILQAIVDVGYLDTKIEHIHLIQDNLEILGASSDHLMVNLNGQEQYRVGDHLQFSLNYEALSHAMHMQHNHKVYNIDNNIETLVDYFDAPIPSKVEQF